MIESLYHLIEMWAPFQWTQFDFMKNALLTVILMAPVFGLTGTMVVNNRMAFFSDAIGHAALTGIAIGVILGFGDPLWAMLIFALVLAILISWAQRVTGSSNDTIIGVFFSTAVALGVVVLSKGGGFARYSKYLVGDILSVTGSDLLLLTGVLVLVLLFWLFAFNRLFLVSFNSSVAGSRGIDVARLETLFAVLVALVVTASIQWVGLLIINALIVLPAAAAKNVANSMRNYTVITVMISLIAGVAGLIMSYYWSTATGATIVLAAFVCYLLTVVWRRLLIR